MSRFVAGLVFAFVCLMRVADCAPAPGAGDKVESAKFFSIGPVGYAGEMSAEESALRVMLKEKGAGVRFHALLFKGTIAGQLYALLGLKLLGAPDFEQCLRPYLKSDAMVETFAGCIGSAATVSVIAGRIEKGDYSKAMR